MPLLFINYLLRKNGWGTIFLGTNVKKSEIAAVAAVPGIRYIYLHLITNFTGRFADDYFEDICREFKDKTLVASGEGTMSVQRTFVNLRILKSDQQIYEFIEQPNLSAEHSS